MKNLQNLGIQRGETLTVKMEGYPEQTGTVFGRGLGGFTLIVEGKPVMFDCNITTIIKKG